MKIFKILFESESYKRTIRIKKKQQDRLNRLKEVYSELNKWDDIPLGWQLPSICETLNIKNNDGARSFVTGLLFGRVDLEKEARKLPLK